MISLWPINHWKTRVLFHERNLTHPSTTAKYRRRISVPTAVAAHDLQDMCHEILVLMIVKDHFLTHQSCKNTSVVSWQIPDSSFSHRKMLKKDFGAQCCRYTWSCTQVVWTTGVNDCKGSLFKTSHIQIRPLFPVTSIIHIFTYNIKSNSQSFTNKKN